MTPRLRHLGVSLLLAAGLLVSAPSSAVSAPSSADVGSTNAYSRTAFTLSNRARADHDLPTLRGNACLRKAALRQAKKIRRDQELSHQDLGRIQRDCSVGYVGENVAYGYPTGRSVVEGWMSSPGHRANILGENYTHLGVAAVKDTEGRWWAVQVFGSR
ncbi:CAP domain-containing protein [uncultured Nocardioides sp.]|uniref:CAP domain-containing protein n=1 Tax=uncultured Nocardioides sp. TaxID=198441 RepID=UPI002605FA8C|nr:CAP domain-containing protein [uncultured Nocardioides sp.]